MSLQTLKKIQVSCLCCFRWSLRARPDNSLLLLSRTLPDLKATAAVYQHLLKHSRALWAWKRMETVKRRKLFPHTPGHKTDVKKAGCWNTMGPTLVCAFLFPRYLHIFIGNHSERKGSQMHAFTKYFQSIHNKKERLQQIPLPVRLSNS